MNSWKKHLWASSVYMFVRFVTVYLVKMYRNAKLKEKWWRNILRITKTFFRIIRLKLTIISTLRWDCIRLEVTQKCTLRQSRIKCSTFNKRHNLRPNFYTLELNKLLIIFFWYTSWSLGWYLSVYVQNIIAINFNAKKKERRGEI